MANRTFCDYCEREITNSNENPIEITLDGDPKDICNECADKVKEVLDSLVKKD